MLVLRKAGRMKLYKFNGNSALVKKLLEIDKELVMSELRKRLPNEKAVVA